MTPLVIVPFHDPAWLGNVEANLARQTVAARVLLVVNGMAAGFESSRWQTTTSAASHAAAVNAGAEWARERDFTHAVLFDSDDYYGHRYLEHTLSALADADYCGKVSIYTWLRSGLHRFDRIGGAFMGGTLGFRLDGFVPMPAVLQDDTEWCRAMARSRARGVDTGSAHYCYVRLGQNAHWRANDVIVRRAMGAGRYYPDASIEAVNAEQARWIPIGVPTDDEVLAAM